MTPDHTVDPSAVDRDPSAYRQTDHFRQMCRYRQFPSPTPALAARAIREGDVRPANEPGQVCFRLDHGRHVWHVIAELREGEANPLVTIYAVNAHGDGEHGGIPRRRS